MHPHEVNLGLLWRPRFCVPGIQGESSEISLNFPWKKIAFVLFQWVCFCKRAGNQELYFQLQNRPGAAIFKQTLTLPAQYLPWRAFVATPVSSDPFVVKARWFDLATGLVSPSCCKPANRLSRVRPLPKLLGSSPHHSPTKPGVAGTPQTTGSLLRGPFQISLLASSREVNLLVLIRIRSEWSRVASVFVYIILVDQRLKPR